MQFSYLTRLGAPVQDFVLELEQLANIDILVVPDSQLNYGGPFGQGNLEVLIEESRCFVYAPTNGYFPDGAVRHELLHVKRFHIDGVPKLTTSVRQRGGISPDAMSRLDNAIEHIAIVPMELRLHPERLNHWAAVLQAVCSGLSDVPREERSLAVCMHWTFLRHVLPGSMSAKNVRQFAIEHGLLEMADGFADQFLASATKEAAVQFLFATFPSMNRDQAVLEYVSSKTGTVRKPIP
jgi:hypothetical protein